MGATPRVAFFADSFHEVNGLALTARALDAYARRQDLPFLCARGSRVTREMTHGETAALDLARSALSVPVDPELSFDPLWPRHVGRVQRALDRRPADLVHVTGVNDMGQLGAWIAHRRRLPLVASWHTNVHEFAARRVERLLRPLGPRARGALAQLVERAVWRGLARFYGLARALLVPNARLAEELSEVTGRPAYLMRRGVDTTLYTPARRDGDRGRFRIGYVGRLAPEKNVRLLASLERRLLDAGAGAFDILVIGHGSERSWLERTLRHGVFPGVLQGEALAHAYASMDVFAFPSETDTFGNVVLEALASGVPAIVSARGGPRTIVQDGISGFVAPDEEAFAAAVLRLMTDRARHDTMRAAARTLACEYSWDAVFGGVYEVYRDVLARARGRPSRQPRHGPEAFRRASAGA